MKRTSIGYIGISAFVYILDSVIKNKVYENLKEERLILKGRIKLRKYKNKGAMLNLMEKKPKQLLCVTGGMLTGTMAYFGHILLNESSSLLKLGTSLIIGGGLNNMVDRVKRGYVRDYFSLNKRRAEKCDNKKSKKLSIYDIVYNISDIFIFVGGILIIIAYAIQDE